MNAIYKRELRSFFTNVLGCFLIALMLFVFGLFLKMFNINNAYTNFEYVLSYSTFVLLILIPLLTMRTFSEERRQKTDQLLYSAPVPMSKVVLGKYFALLTIFAIPLAVAAFYPIILSFFGKVYFLTTYTSFIGYFLLGATLTSIGLFVSTLTENMIISALISFVAMFMGYWATNLSSLISDKPSAALYLCSALVLVLVLVMRSMTGNWTLALSVGIGLEFVVLIIYLIFSQWLSGVTLAFLDWLALFAPFSKMVNGVFDLTVIVYYLTIIALFLFLSVQSMEKRRWS